MGLSPKQMFQRLELPFSAVNLTWNSLMSMAGGWFFLMVCEAFTLGDKEYRLPGIGAYMAVAIKEDNLEAKIYGVLAMVLVIVILDFLIWRPMLSWVRRFRLEDVPGTPAPEPLMLLALRESRLIRFLRFQVRRRQNRRRIKPDPAQGQVLLKKLGAPIQRTTDRLWMEGSRVTGPLLWVFSGTLLIYGVYKLGLILIHVPSTTWMTLLQGTLKTLLRVAGALLLSTIWAVPFGIWVGLSPKRVRIAQPIVQVLASFPAPMLYPLALGIFFALGFNFSWSAMLLMFLGVQWYVLFNVLAGALRISAMLNDTLTLMQASAFERWRTLYLPSVFPSLLTGWITAAGGAWNASIAAEYLPYKNGLLVADGIGAAISQAAAGADFQSLAAGLSLMVVVVLGMNRLVWARAYDVAQTQYRMDA